MDQFRFDMLTLRQLIKLCSAYSIYIQGAMPNNKSPYQDVLEAVTNELNLGPDGDIYRKSDKPSEREARLLNWNGLRVIIV